MEFQADWNTDQVNPSTSPKAHCNGLFLTCRDEPNKRLVQHKKGKAVQKKIFHAVNNVPAGECCQKLLHQCGEKQILTVLITFLTDLSQANHQGWIDASKTKSTSSLPQTVCFAH